MCAVATATLLAGCGMFKDKMADSKDWGPKEYYALAQDESGRNNWGEVIKILEQLESKFPFGRYAQQAQIEIAYAHYKEGDTAQCIAAAEKFMKQHPNHANVDYALYMKGLANFKEDLGPLQRIATQDLADRDPKAARESFEVFKELVTRFPESRYAEDSRYRMAYLVDALARHEVHVAQYYMRRGAWLAAVNRAQGILLRYPNAPTRRDALEIMIEGYDKMGLADLRDDTKKVLAKNFPANPTASTTSSWWKFW